MEERSLIMREPNKRSNNEQYSEVLQTSRHDSSVDASSVRVVARHAQQESPKALSVVLEEVMAIRERALGGL